jgi:hypothetical protein
MEVSLFTERQFATAIDSAAAQLEGAQRALRTIICPSISALTANLQALNAPQIERLLTDVPTGYRKSEKNDDHVYIIESTVGPALVSTLLAQLTEARKSQADYSRANSANIPTSTLYAEGAGRTCFHVLHSKSRYEWGTSRLLIWCVIPARS